MAGGSGKLRCARYQVQARRDVDLAMCIPARHVLPFYRWAQLWPQICPKLSAAPKVLAIGDLHVENFGTWRDIEGRLIWGINDFDEVFLFAYTADLVLLATSAHLAIAIYDLGIVSAN